MADDQEFVEEPLAGEESAPEEDFAEAEVSGSLPEEEAGTEEEYETEDESPAEVGDVIMRLGSNWAARRPPCLGSRASLLPRQREAGSSPAGAPAGRWSAHDVLGPALPAPNRPQSPPRAPTQALENETARIIAKKERERLKLQDRLRREQLEKFREQQNADAEAGEVGGALGLGR